MSQWLFVDKNTGQVAGSYGLATQRTPAGDELAPEGLEMVRAEIMRQTGLAPTDLLPYEITSLAEAQALKHPAGDLVVDVQDGVVVSIAPAPVPPAVYLHLGISGGDGQSPLGLANAGESWRGATVNFALRATADPASPIIPADDNFRMRLRDKRTGAAKLVKLAVMTAGQGQITITLADGHPTGELVLDEADFVPVAGYQVRLATPFEIVIFEP